MGVHVEPLPHNFVFTKNDKFYYSPATCHSVHYTWAAVIAGIVELVILAVGAVCCYVMSNSVGSLHSWMTNSMIVLTAFSIITTIIMFVGLVMENPSLFWPKLTFIRVEIVILLISATIAVASMSFGIDFTRYFYSFAAEVWMLERDFGPIWPFNVSVVSFFTAATCIWTNIVVQGASDYLQDKAYFSQAQAIPLERTLPRAE